MAITLTNPRFTAHDDLLAVARGDKLLRIGAGGDGIVAIQRALQDMGFAIRAYPLGGQTRGGADGDFGPQTEGALKNFQAYAQVEYPGLSIDGVIGPNTLRALDTLSPPPDTKAWEGTPTGFLPGNLWEGEEACKIVVVTGEHRTFLYDDTGALAGIVPNATGARATRTDPGLKRVDGILGEEQARQLGIRLWSSPGAFGARIINLSWHDGGHSGEELHGTNRPDQLGLDVSHGCVRHYNEDIIRLSEAVSVGDRVAIIERVDDPRLSQKGGGSIA